jgi:RNA polymerase sigma factor (sigma-70 family)
MNEPLEGLARRARAGDREALESLVSAIQDRIYGMALRMLWHPEDARDAAQEILLRIVTHLGTFRGTSSFATWTYRVAANYLLTARKSRLEERSYTFQRLGDELDEGLSEDAARQASGEAALLLEEVKLGCTLAMLTCLDRPHRLAYILGEILEMDGGEAARVLGIGAAVFRKRLSRAREAGVRDDDDGLHLCTGEPASGTPSRRKMVMAGQAFVKADWKRLAPTKAVNSRKPGWTQ